MKDYLKKEYFESAQSTLSKSTCDNTNVSFLFAFFFSVSHLYCYAEVGTGKCFLKLAVPKNVMIVNL